jgi:uncharacterized membrane protein YbaN (DUF454 family)
MGNGAGAGPVEGLRKEVSLYERMLRGALVGAGTFFLALGIVGIVLPILPTTPFLLLAAACYARGSRRFYDWLLGNRVFGRYIRNYREGRGITFRDKAVSIGLLWLTILFSVLLVVRNLWVKIVLIAIAVGVSTYLLAIRTLRE